MESEPQVYYGEGVAVSKEVKLLLEEIDAEFGAWEGKGW